jgi:hypothetical protein
VLCPLGRFLNKNLKDKNPIGRTGEPLYHDSAKRAWIRFLQGPRMKRRKGKPTEGRGELATEGKTSRRTRRISDGKANQPKEAAN